MRQSEMKDMCNVMWDEDSIDLLIVWSEGGSCAARPWLTMGN